MANTDTYTFLEPDPYPQKSVNTTGEVPAYFSYVYNGALTLAVALAIIMIVIGGIEYTTSWASPSAKGAAKTKIWSAIGGLVLALLSYLLLTTINPDLLKRVIPNK